jgi:hypothetical protein
MLRCANSQKSFRVGNAAFAVLLQSLTFPEKITPLPTSYPVKIQLFRNFKKGNGKWE